MKTKDIALAFIRNISKTLSGYKTNKETLISMIREPRFKDILLSE
jgi:hypothetical protein